MSDPDLNTIMTIKRFCNPVAFGLVFIAGFAFREESWLSASLVIIAVCVHWLGRPQIFPVQLEILDHVVETTHLNPVVRQAARRALQEINYRVGGGLTRIDPERPRTL